MAVMIVKLAIDNSEQTWCGILNPYMKEFSSCGLCHDLRKVGPKAEQSIAVTINIDHNGELVSNHKGIETRAPINMTQSDFVIWRSPLRKVAIVITTQKSR